MSARDARSSAPGDHSTGQWPHEPEHRYADVMALARDVAALRAGEPVTAYRENVFERVRRFAMRHSTPILLVLAYLIMRVDVPRRRRAVAVPR